MEHKTKNLLQEIIGAVNQANSTKLSGFWAAKNIRAAHPVKTEFFTRHICNLKMIQANKWWDLPNVKMDDPCKIFIDCLMLDLAVKH